ncbi:MAG: response regulator transcription factor [Sphingobacteriales bacterium]
MSEQYKPKILLVEDEPNFGSVLKDYLELNDYKVYLYADGLAGKGGFDKEKYDLILLDVMLPKIDGFTLGRYIRSRDMNIPLIYITAKTMKPDVIEGFKTGADDYITKPFDSEVMLLKIKAILKRNREEKEETPIDENFSIGEYIFNYKLRKLSRNETNQLLSPRESELLKLLCSHFNDIAPRSEALIKIWHEDNYFTTRSMDVFIARLRKYLKDDPKVEIVNIHGNGFILRVN